jgi:hypothetical protein
MGLIQSPRVATDGLVFYYDQNNPKSYQGPAIQNLAATLAFNNTTGTGISIAGGYETVNVPQIGQANAVFSNIQNNYTAFSPNSGDCCPSPLYYGSGFAVSPSTLYTYAIVYKVDSGYTNANYMYRYEFTSNGGTYVGEAGVHNASNRIHLGDGWYWAWATFTTAATTNWIGYHSAFYYRYSNKNDKLTIARVLIAQGNHTGLHPRYWPAVNTTRSNTQAILDLSRQNTVTANSLTYTSNNSFSFNGTNNSITIGQTLNYIPALSNFTLETWIRVPAYPTAAANNVYGQTDRAGVLFGATYYSGAALYWNGNSAGTALNVYAFIRGQDAYRQTSSKSISLNTWTHLVMVNNNAASLIQFYVDGVLFHETTGPSQQYDTSLVPTAGNIGLCKAQIDGGGTSNYSNLNCEIPVAKIYKDKALTAAEVRQNFNALRGRYGV